MSREPCKNSESEKKHEQKRRRRYLEHIIYEKNFKRKKWLRKLKLRHVKMDSYKLGVVLVALRKLNQCIFPQALAISHYVEKRKQIKKEKARPGHMDMGIVKKNLRRLICIVVLFQKSLEIVPYIVIDQSMVL